MKSLIKEIFSMIKFYPNDIMYESDAEKYYYEHYHPSHEDINEKNKRKEEELKLKEEELKRKEKELKEKEKRLQKKYSNRYRINTLLGEEDE